MNSIGKFHGGLVLDGHKLLSHISDSILPERLIYPLLQRSDNYATPCISIGERVLKGQVIAQSNSPLVAPIHAASSGIITAIANHPIAHPSGLDDSCIILSTDGLDEAIAVKPLINKQSKSPDALRQLIHQAGIVGLGGALFPTATKLQNTTALHTLIINGAECEPYISCDLSLIQSHAEQIVQGVLILQNILQADQCIIALEQDSLFAYDALEKAIETQTSTKSQTLRLQKVPTIYPTGGEKQLIQVLTGIKIAPSVLPTTQGFLCQNIATVFAIYQAISQRQPLIERIVTVTGHGIQQAKNIRARIGTPIHHLIKQCGGYADKVERLIMGGSMMGIALKTDDIAITKATNCLLVMTHNDLRNQKIEMPCIRCGDCASVCPIELLPQQLHWYGHTKQFEQSQNYHLFDCIECGCCDLVCPSHIPLVQSFRATKEAISIKRKQTEQAQLAKMRYENQQQRRAKAEQYKLAATAKRKMMIEKMKATASAKKQQT